MIDEDFRILLSTFIAANTSIEKGTVAKERLPTRVYFQRSDAEQDLMLNANQALTTTTFNIEAAALSDDATVQTLADQMKTGLNGFRGAFGTNSTSVALGIFVADHADDYQPRGVDADDGYHVAAFQARVIHL